MADWNRYVRERLSLPRIEHRRVARITNEIAEQLREIHDAARARGATPEEARQEVERHITDWHQLAADLASAERPNRVPATTRWIERREETARASGSMGQLAADFLRDARYALRGLRRDKSFTGAVILVLALGIGATTSMYAVVDALLLEPLAYPEPDRLVMVWTTNPGEGRSTMPLSGPNYADILERSSSFQELGAQDLEWVNLASQGPPQRVRASLCSPSLLRALGVSPAQGRFFTDEEMKDEEPVVILSEGLWQRQFGGSKGVIGGTITINGDPHTVVGVMPETYTTPRPWYTSHGADLWLPVEGAGYEVPRARNWLFALGRLAPGVTLEAANEEVRIIAADLAQEHPDTNARTDFWVMPLKERLVGGVFRPVIFLAGGAALLLLISGANVANILFARATARQSLTAIRASLGASRARLLRQVITESLLLTAAGGILGLALATWGVGILRRAFPPAIQRAENIALDTSVVFLALAATLALGLVVGLAVGLFQTRFPLTSLARQGLRTRSPGRRRARIQGTTVAIQFALTMLLAHGTALMFRSYLNALHIPLAFDTSGTLTAGITLEGQAYEDETAALSFWSTFLDRVQAIPGVERVGLVSKLPLNGGTNGSVLVEKEEHDPEAERPLVEFSYATGGYFGAMGIPLLEGRVFVPEDATKNARGIIVNRAFAEGYFPGESALGKAVREDSSEGNWSGFIVGVVEDVPQWGLERPTLREIYFPFSVRSITSPSLALSSNGSPGLLVPSIREELASLDATIPLSNVRTMADVVATDVQSRRMLTLVIALFSVVGILLGGTGIYGVLAYHVACRRQEMGIRMALGAEAGRVVRMVLRQGLILAGLGTLLGFLTALFLSRGLAGLLFGVTPVDPLSLGLVLVVLAAVAILGTMIPARRAAAVHPSEALRGE